MKWLDDLQADMWGFLSTSLAMTWMAVVRSVKIWHRTPLIRGFTGILAGLCLPISAVANGLHLDPSPCFILGDNDFVTSYRYLEASPYPSDQEDARRIRNFRDFYSEENLSRFILESASNTIYPEYHIPIRNYTLIFDLNCENYCTSTFIYDENGELHYIKVIHSILTYKSLYASDIESGALIGMEAFFLSYDRKYLVRIYGIIDPSTMSLQNMRPYYAIPITNFQIIPLEGFTHPNREIVLRCADPEVDIR